MKKREITIEFFKPERMNTYKILAEFFAKKFNENEIDKVKQKS